MTEVIEQSGANLYEKPEEAASSKAFVRRWLEAINLSEKEEEDWRKIGSEAVEIYCADEASKIGTAFNLYHANIETIIPALYNSTPVPDIRRRYGDKDEHAKIGADAIERALTYSIDDYDFDEVMERVVHHFAAPGRGIARVYYDSTEVPVMGQDGKPLMLPDGSPAMDTGAEFVRSKVVPWHSFRRGPGKCWEEVPWEAFQHHYTRKDLEELNPKIAKDVKLDLSDSKSGDDDANKPESDIFKKVVVWEIWDKAEREVLFISEGYPDDVIARKPDPLNLKDFFPNPRPLQINRGDDTLVPLCSYQVQKPLLAELDEISRRIRRLVKQLRPRALGPDGVDMQKLAKADDGEIVGVTDVIQFLEGGGMDKLLAWFPMEPTVKAIQSLYDHRERVKGDLFEVSGLADVMRGQSNASETLGAQQMKTQWGSLRIQRGQQEVQRFARDLLRMKAELIAEKFKPETIAAMTGMELNSPAIAIIKDDRMRGYKIDIETDSTIRGDLTRNMEAMAQFMQGTAQYLQAMAPALEMGIPMDVLMVVYTAFARNFKLGKEVDAVLSGLPDMLKKQQEMAAQQPPQPSPEEMKAKVEIETIKAKSQMEMEKGKADLAMKGQAGQMDLQIKQAELQLKGQEMQMKQAEMGMKAQANQVNHAMTMEHQQQSHELGMEQMVQQAKIKAAAAKMQPKAQGQR